MTDEQRGALVSIVSVRAAYADRSPHDMSRNEYDLWDNLSNETKDRYAAITAAILAAIEPAIRADERAKVMAEATTDEAVALACKWYNGTPDRDFEPSDVDPDLMRSAIRVALGDKP